MRLPERPRAVITGAGGGLGRAFCLELAKKHAGARVVVSDLRAEAAEQTAAMVRELGGETAVFACDVSKAEQVEALAREADARFGGTDLLVNNAGVAASGPMGDVPLEDWEWILGVNLWGVVYGCHTFVPRFKAQGSGAIINVASAAGLLSAPGMGPYNVTKAAVVSLSETLRAELEPFRIGVTALCPTFFMTDIVASGRLYDRTAKGMAEKMMQRSKIQAPEVARAALASLEKGELYCVPMADGRALWWLKRLLPEAYYGPLSRMAQRAVLRKR